MQITWAYIHRLYILSNICRGGKIYCIPAMSQTQGSRKCSRLRGSRGATCFIFTSSLNSFPVLCGPMRRDQRIPKIQSQTFYFLIVNGFICVNLLFFPRTFRVGSSSLHQAGLPVLSDFYSVSSSRVKNFVSLK